MNDNKKHELVFETDRFLNRIDLVLESQDLATRVENVLRTATPSMSGVLFARVNVKKGHICRKWT